MLQYCILTSLFFRLLGPEGEIFLVCREIGYLWFVGCKVLPKFCFCNLIKIGPNSIYKRQRQCEYLLFSRAPLFRMPTFNLQRHRENCNFAIYNFTSQVTSSQNIDASTQSQKEFTFCSLTFEIFESKMQRRSENNNGHFCSKLRLTQFIFWLHKELKESKCPSFISNLSKAPNLYLSLTGQCQVSLSSQLC